MIAAAVAACLPDETPREAAEEIADVDQTILDEGDAAGPITPGAYPWLVSVDGCGAALVASNVVLTAAHCVDVNYPQYEDEDIGDTHVPFSGKTSVTVFSAAGVPTEVSQAVTRLSGAGQVGPAIAPSDFAGGDVGIDLALVVFAPADAVPRRILTPAKVGTLFDVVSSSSRVLSPKTHRLNDDGECVEDTGNPTFLESRDVDAETDRDGWPAWRFFTANSYTCRGDSGSPVVTGSTIVSLISSGDQENEHVGPALTLDIRDWLVARALDRDGDGWEAWEDKCDTHPNWPKGRQYAQRDQDGDGVSPPCDPCDNVPQEWLYDADGDELVDCVDPCPFAPGEKRLDEDDPERWGDEDGDGICDDVDTCIKVSTPVPYENSNLEAEDAWSAEVIPDACDPVLIPKGAIDWDQATEQVLRSVQTTFYKSTTSVVRTDWVTRQHRASRSRTHGENGKETVAGVVTHARFCQPGPFTANCLAPEVIDEEQLRLDLAGAIDEDATMAYHRIKLGTSSRGAAWTRTYDDSVDVQRWDYQADEAFWTANGIVIVPPEESHPLVPEASASGLSGTMWFHAASPVGHPGSPSNDVDTGIHQALEDVDDTAQLASHYFALDPERIHHQEKHFPLELDQPIFAWRDLPRWPDEEVFWGVDPLDDLMLFETTSQDIGYLTADGLLAPLGDVVSTTLQTMMRDGGIRWLRSEEAASHRSLAGAPLAVGLAADGARLVDVAVAWDGGTKLRTGREAGSALSGATLPAASGFGAVYARSMGAVFRVGGTERTTGSAGGLWRLDASTGQATGLWLGVPLGTILAATFDAATREIVVLDRVALRTPRGAYDVRVVRIDAWGRDARVVGSWRADGPCRDHQLLVDGRGRLMLAANQGTSGHIVYALKGEEKELEARRVTAGTKTLPTAAWSNERTLYLPVRLSPTTGTVAVSKIDLAVEGTSSDIAAECF